ncbi:hypothetical protein FDP41_010104 [Naegleria fowleri]|uniref:Carrier domain-containing protein n=1 Tax=Naegleria fowleri TaxID=5763 RepID=A0A6A5BAE5_NAEFO|nr:uncharacterized protein FDP41_010104 [Naegleria fowleri]KAF0971881.1 hypothetical protein FDP41_010104 [Naegleria fowleri]
MQEEPTAVITIDDYQVEWPIHRNRFYQENSVLGMIEYWCSKTPQNPCIERTFVPGETVHSNVSKQLNYEEFKRAILLTRRLLHDKIGAKIAKGSCVALLHENSLVYSVIVFALFSLGYIVFPVNHKLTTKVVSKLLELGQVQCVSISPHILQSMIQESSIEDVLDLFSKCETYLWSSDISEELQDLQILLNDEKFSQVKQLIEPLDIMKDISNIILNKTDNTLQDEVCLEYPAKFNDPSFYVNTSGSTNIPKIVVHSQRSIMSSLHYSHKLHYSKLEFIVNFLPLYHLMGFYNLLTSLYHGTCYIMFNNPKSENMISSLYHVLKHHEAKLSRMSIPSMPILMNQIKEEVERGDDIGRMLISELSKSLFVTMGGVSTPNYLITFLQDNRINCVNGYGMSEIGVCLASERFTGAFKSMNCLLPCKFYIWKEREGDALELYLAKGCPTCGLTYISVGNYAKFWNEEEGNTFCTHDLFYEFPRNHYVYLSRADDILCHTNGEMTNPQPIEAAVKGFDPCITHAVILGHNRPFCVAIFETDKDREPSDFTKIVRKKIKDLNKTLPIHSRLSLDFLVLNRNEKLPLTELKGLVSRKKTEQMYADKIENLYNPQNVIPQSQPTSKLVEHVTNKPPPLINPQEFISLLKNQVFPEVKNIDLDTSLPGLGMDSLSLIQFRNLLFKNYGVMPSVDEIFQLGTPRQIIKRLQNIEEEGTKDELSDIREKIANDVQFLSKKIVKDCTSSAHPLKHEFIFLTGATGMLGAYVINDLAKLEEVKKIYCLCRGNSVSHAVERLMNNMKLYNLWNDFTLNNKVRVILGDVATERMGIEESIYSELLENVDVIYHIGSAVDFVQPYSSLKAANVDGTSRVIELALTRKIKPLAYISSISAAPKNEDGSLREEIIQLSKLNQKFGYPQTKIASELLLTEAKQRLGLPILIFRPALIVGDEPTGKMQRGFLVERMLKSMHRVGVAPNLDILNNLINVDYVSNIIVSAVRHGYFDLEVVHITNRNPPSHSDILSHLKDHFSSLFGHVQEGSWQQFLDEIAKKDIKEDGMYPLVQWAREGFIGELDTERKLVVSREAFEESIQHFTEVNNRLTEMRGVERKELDVFKLLGRLVEFSLVAANDQTKSVESESSIRENVIAV